MRAVALAPLLLGACLEVPPASCPSGAGDADQDGWSCGGPVPDCDDGNPDINPGLIDDCDTIEIEDCGGEPRACPGLAGLVANTDPGESTWDVHNGGLSAEFEQGQQWVLSSLKRDGDPTELLSQVNGVAEQYVGVTLYPPWDQYQVTTAVPTALDQGPAYVRIQIEWEHTVAGEAASGISMFAFTPNGTIHRHETFESVGYTIPNASVVTHWTVTEAAFTHLVVPMGTVLLSEQPNFQQIHHHEGGPDDDGTLCAYDLAADRRLTMAWTEQDEFIGSRAIIGNEIPSRRLALNYDWYRDVATVPPGTFESETSLTVDTPDDGGSPCASTSGLSDALRDTSVMILTGEPADRADEDGYVAADGLYAIEAQSGEAFVEARVTDTILRGLTLRAVLGAEDGVTVWWDEALQRAQVDYLVQPSDDGATVFIPGRVDAGTTVRIAAPGGEPI